MATRRSRLQVKPNIGGPKIGGPKAPPPLKIPDRSSKKAEVGPSSPLKSPRVTSPIKSPRVTSPVKSPRVSSPVKSTRVTTPLKSPRVAYPIRGTSNKVVSLVGNSHGSVENNGSEQQKDTTPNVEIKNDNQVDSNKRGTETSEGTGSITEQSGQAPKRARLRRFGTVNVGLTRGPKTASNESQVVDNNTTSEAESQKIDREMGMDIKESQETDVDNAAGELNEKGDTNTNEGSGIQMQQKGSNIDMAEAKAAENGVDKAKPKPTTRARLPKAKPNFLDAARKRSKPSEENAAAGSDNSQESLVLEPSSASCTSKATGESNTSDTLASSTKYTSIKAKPDLPMSPQKSHVAHPLQSSPVKMGGKLYGDKDRYAKQKSVSLPEPVAPQPPPAKKVRLPRVDAPTDKPPNRGRMRMRDLIYWNPTNNPMKTKEKPVIEVKEIKEKGKDKVKEKENTVQEPPPPVDGGGEDEAMPVPQVTIGPDGNIVINEQSLVVKNSLEDKGPSQEDEPIDETEMFSTYGTFRKMSRSRRWSEKETAKFYKALAMVGIDFFLIQKILPNRQRFELTKKFKKEEKKNGPLIERVLKERLHFDESVFENISEEEEDEKEIKKREQQEKKEKRKREREEKRKEAAEKKKKTGLRTGRLRKNPYEPDASSSDSEVEKEIERELRRELEKNFRENPDVRETGKDKARPGGSKSGNDTEVVNILMDMSKGRLPGVEGVGNVVQPNGAPIQYVNQSYADDTVTIIPQGSQQVYLNNGNNLIANLQQSIPGIQNIIAIEAQPLFPQGVEPSLTGSDLRAVAEGQTTSNVIVENNYPPYEIIEPPTAVSSAVISSQSEIGESLLQTDVNNDLTNVEMVNVEPGNSQAENQTYMVDNANQIYSQTSAYRVNQKTPHNNSAKEVIVDNSANESYTAISAGPVENVTSENEVLILNSGNDTHAANSETNTFPSPSQSYTSNQSSVLDGNIQAYEATKTVTTNRTVAKSLRKETVSRANENRTIKLVKTAAGDIVEIEIINDELETVKTEPDIETTRDKVLHVGAEKEVQSKARAEQAAESIMQALRQKLEAAKNTPKPPTRHVVPSPVQPGRSLLKSTPHSARTVPSSSQVKLVRGPAQPARSPSQSAQSILPAAQSLAPTVQGPSGTSQSPGPIAANPAGTAPSSSLESTSAVQTPKSPVANVLPSLGPTFNGNQIISQTLLSPESASRMPGLPQPGPNDQYVLVTVMPESGQETIIHVYRLHGGQLAQ